LTVEDRVTQPPSLHRLQRARRVGLNRLLIACVLLLPVLAIANGNYWDYSGDTITQ
jgi:hypothetical protein